MVGSSEFTQNACVVETDWPARNDPIKREKGSRVLDVIVESAVKPSALELVQKVRRQILAGIRVAGFLFLPELFELGPKCRVQLKASREFRGNILLVRTQGMQIHFLQQ